MPSRYNIDSIINKKINSLLILSEGKIHKTKGGNLHRTILCKCDCGKTKTFQLSSVLNKSIKSCGCHSSKTASKRMKILNTKHGLYNTLEYNTWQSIKKRCLNVNHKYYKYYGGRGITICESWKNSFENFLNDMGIKPSKEYSIDRIDNNKGYDKENCRWTTNKIQSRNVRTNVIYSFKNEKRCISEWSEILKMTRYKTIKYLNENGGTKN